MHFLALGALVFFLFHLTTDRGETQDGKIVVTRGKVEQLVTGFREPGSACRRKKSLTG